MILILPIGEPMALRPKSRSRSRARKASCWASARSRTLVPWIERNSMWRIPCRVRTSSCSTGSGEISSAKALRRIMGRSRIGSVSRFDVRRSRLAGGPSWYQARAKPPAVGGRIGRPLRLGCSAIDVAIPGLAELSPSTNAGAPPCSWSIWPFLIYCLILFVVCYIVVEYRQNYLYDEATPGLGSRSRSGRSLLAAILSWTRTSFDTMFTSDIHKTCSRRSSGSPSSSSSSGSSRGTAARPGESVRS